MCSKTISFTENSLLPVLYGEHDKHLKLVELEMSVSITTRGNFLQMSGNKDDVEVTKNLLESLYEDVKKNNILDVGELKGKINIFKDLKSQVSNKIESIDSLSFSAGKRLIKPRSKKQVEYFNLVKKKDLVFCCGPAGTGKTYLAVALAVSMLKSGQIDKIILSRPAVEAGERLGFLPGDLKEKIDPYLRPIYDALNDMLSFSEVLKKIENGLIEIAPLAFMRGRTLSNSFIILDESQNTTAIQMKMFLTRLGENSKMIVNGDLSQVDLPSGTKSGLRESMRILKNIDDIGFVEFTDKDVVRNSLVSKIVSKYEEFERLQGVGQEYKKNTKND
ncbi:MAG: phosphate starvation-inducible protein PhoH [Pelagibacteraceae bacterium TMED65]|nr:phosphate starvation-inducible protein PhoH [Rickettsiales bacterium]OUU52069.1 MAG: phosphate starvation-inducible protein PhoH [Pelagibacteraceae bacterium TMED65]